MNSEATITLAHLPSFDDAVHPQRTVSELFELLERDERTPGVMVVEEGRFLTAISRARLLELMRRRFSYELFWDKPLTEVLGRWTVEPMIVPAETSVSAAVNAALERHDDTLTEPVVCVDASGRHTLIDMHTLLAAQCSELARMNDDLADAHRSTERASRAKSEFLANVSHEIRTPMTAILGYAEVLEGESLDPQRAAAARTIRRSGEHLLGLLNDILDVSKIESGRFEVEPVEHDGVQVVREAVDLLKVRAQEKGVGLQLVVNPDAPTRIVSDPTRLRQIVSNLIGNAVKFTSKGLITVTVALDRSLGDRPQDALLSVAVEDTGIGIPRDSLQKLFQPFVQADATMSRRFGGSGLGLAISRRLARILGGDLTATSTEGVGSRFVATLCAGLQRVTGAAMEKPRQQTGPAGPLNIRVLVAEDGSDNQRLFHLHLTKAGARVHLVGDGEQALQAATAPGACFDLVLMDMQMPGVDGYQATAELRKRGYAGPIVALTAHAMAADRERAIAAGCDDYLTKPIPREALIEACRRWGASAMQRAA